MSVRKIMAAMVIVVFGFPVMALERGHPFTGPREPMQAAPAQPMGLETTDERRQMRSFPDQPPVIPHSVRDYQVDLNTNRCLSCHSREFAAQARAPMISVTHFQDRDGQMLAGVAPRRYFCMACHVQQTTSEPPVANTYAPVGTVAGGQLQRPGGQVR